MLVPALTLLPALAALVLLSTLLGALHRYARRSHKHKSRWYSSLSFSRRLPRAFFDLPPRRGGPRIGLLLLVPSAALALVAGSIALARDGDHGAALALAVTAVPSALCALGLWDWVRNDGMTVWRRAAVVALGILPPLAAGLLAGFTTSRAPALVLTTLSSLVAAALALRSWSSSAGLVLASAPPSPFGSREKFGLEQRIPAAPPWHGDHAAKAGQTGRPVAPGGPPITACRQPNMTQGVNNHTQTATHTPLPDDFMRHIRGHNHTRNPSAAVGSNAHSTRTHGRTDSYISERSDVDTIPEWSFSFACTTATAGGARESIVVAGGLGIPEEVAEEYEGDASRSERDRADGITQRLSLDSHRSHDSHSGPTDTRTPHQPTHKRNGSTPYATDYSVIASYSPNPFMPLPRGFESLTNIRAAAASEDTLALCDENSKARRSLGPDNQATVPAPASAAGRGHEGAPTVPAGPRERDASGLTNHTFTTESDGPIRIDLSSFETSNTNSNSGTATTLASMSTSAVVERPAEPTPERMLTGNGIVHFAPAKTQPSPLRPAGPRAATTSAPRVPCTPAAISTSHTASTPHVSDTPHHSHVSGAPHRSPRRKPVPLTLSPIPGTSDGPRSVASPAAPSPTGTYVDEHPRHLWLLAVVCVVVCYGLNVPLLAGGRTIGTLAAFATALFVPSPLLAIAVFYPRRTIQLPTAVGGSVTSVTSMTRAAKEEQEQDMSSYVNIDVEAGRPRDDRKYMLELNPDLFPTINIPVPTYPAPAADPDYPYHAYKLKAATQPKRDPATGSANDNPLHGQSRAHGRSRGQTRRHTFTEGDELNIVKRTPTADWFANGHARNGLSTLGRATEMLKPKPALCVMQEMDAAEQNASTEALNKPATSTRELPGQRRNRERQSLVERLRGGIVSMIAKCDLPEIQLHVPTIHVSAASGVGVTPSPTESGASTKDGPGQSAKSTKSSKSPKAPNTPGTGLTRKGSKGSISHSLSSMDISRDSELSDLGGGSGHLGVAQIQVATLGRRSPSSSFYLAKDKMEFITTGILTDLGLVGGTDRASSSFEAAGEIKRVVRATREAEGEESKTPTTPKTPKTPKSQAAGTKTKTPTDPSHTKTKTQPEPASHRPRISVDLPFRPSVDCVDESTPRRPRPSCTHKRNTSSVSTCTLDGVEGLDFSRPSYAPTIDYAASHPRTHVIDYATARPRAPGAASTATATVINMDSSEARAADLECDQSIYHNAALAEKFLQQELESRKEWAALQSNSPFLRAMRTGGSGGGSRGPSPVPPHPLPVPTTSNRAPVAPLPGLPLPVPATPNRARVRVPRGSSTSITSTASTASLPPDLVRYLRANTQGSTSPAAHSYRESIASLSPMDALGAEEMEQVMAMDTPSRNRYVSTPSVRSARGAGGSDSTTPASAPGSSASAPGSSASASSSASAPVSSSGSHARLPSDASATTTGTAATAGTIGTTATERRRFISNASSWYALSEASDPGPPVAAAAYGALPDHLANMPLPPPPPAVLHHPHPPPLPMSKAPHAGRPQPAPSAPLHRHLPTLPAPIPLATLHHPPLQAHAPGPAPPAPRHAQPAVPPVAPPTPLQHRAPPPPPPPSLQHPHPPPIPSLPPRTTDRYKYALNAWFESTESLAAVMERSFEGTEYSARFDSVVEGGGEQGELGEGGGQQHEEEVRVPTMASSATKTTTQLAARTQTLPQPAGRTLPAGAFRPSPSRIGRANRAKATGSGLFSGSIELLPLSPAPSESSAATAPLAAGRPATMRASRPAHSRPSTGSVLAEIGNTTAATTTTDSSRATKGSKASRGSSGNARAGPNASSSMSASMSTSMSTSLGSRDMSGNLTMASIGSKASKASKASRGSRSRGDSSKASVGPGAGGRRSLDSFVDKENGPAGGMGRTLFPATSSSAAARPSNLSRPSRSRPYSYPSPWDDLDRELDAAVAAAVDVEAQTQTNIRTGRGRRTFAGIRM